MLMKRQINVVKVRQGKVLQFIPPPHRDSSSATISPRVFLIVYSFPLFHSQVILSFSFHLMFSLGEVVATFLTFAALLLEIFVLVSGSGNLPVLRDLYFVVVEYGTKFTRLGLW